MRHGIFLLIAISSVLIGTMPIAAMGSSSVKIQCITSDELKKLMDNNDPNILVIDTQPKAGYDMCHLKGAVNFPWAMDIKNPGNLPRDKMLILYCDCSPGGESVDILGTMGDKSGACSATDDSTDVAQQLISKFGYKKIKILEGGLSKWKALGYPLEKCSD